MVLIFGPRGVVKHIQKSWKCHIDSGPSRVITNVKMQTLKDFRSETDTQLYTLLTFSICETYFYRPTCNIYEHAKSSVKDSTKNVNDSVCVNKANLRDFISCDRSSNVTQIALKSPDLSTCVTLKLIWWLRRKNIRHLSCNASSFVHHFKAAGEFKLECKNRRRFVPCDLKIGRMTLKKQRTPRLCYFELCASFYSHQWNQTGAKARKRPILVKVDDFMSRVTLKFDG